MFSFLDLINQSLSYFNINTRLKNRVYTLVALLGDCYLIYVTARLLANHVWLRGLLYCLAVIFVTYFAYLNIIFFFLGRTSKFDFLSPYIRPLVVDDDGQPTRRQAGQPRPAASNGIYHNTETIPAHFEADSLEQRNLNKVVRRLLDAELVTANFNGMSGKEVIAQYEKTGQPVHAIDDNQVPPYFELIHDQGKHRMEISIWVNQMERLAVGHITQVGLTDIHTAHDKYKLYLANVTIVGGPYKIPGRNGSTIMMNGDYRLAVQVAYRDRQENN